MNKSEHVQKAAARAAGPSHGRLRQAGGTKPRYAFPAAMTTGAARSKLRVFRFEVCGVAELVHRGLRGCFPGNAGRKRDTGLAPGAPIW